jgi:hypothetical protein
MFYDPSILGTFLVERLSGGGKMLRRIVGVHRDGTMTISKPSGIVRRIIPLANITHLVTSPDVEETDSDEGDENVSPSQLAALKATEQQALSKRRRRLARNGAWRESNRDLDSFDDRAWVLIRVASEHDVLFLHVPMDASKETDVSSAWASFGADPRLTQSRSSTGALFIDLLQRERGKLRALPLRVATKANCSVLRDAADVVRQSSFAKPRAFAVLHQILAPSTFDDFPIVVPEGRKLSDANEIRDDIVLSVETSFLCQLHRSARAHPSAASQPPLVLIDSPEPYPSLEISARFLSAFCVAFDDALPLMVLVQSHLPKLTTFRASKRFWAFVHSTLRVTRPPQSIVAMLGSSHVVAHIDGDETTAMTATVQEWNDMVIAWESDVRSRLRVGPSGPEVRQIETAENCFWESFVAELAALSATSSV